MEAKEKLENLHQKYVINGVIITPIGPIYSLSTALWINRLKKLLKKRNTLNSHADKFNQPGKEKLKPFRQQTVLTESLTLDNKSQFTETYVTPSETTVDSSCKCEREINIHLRNKCPCEECNAEQRRKDATYIVSGIKDGVNKAPLNILYGVQDQQCHCLFTYLEKMRRLKEYRQRCQAAYELKKKGVKYALGGVTYTEKGPIYQIFGMRPPVRCVCEEVLNEADKLEEQMRRLPKIPSTGRITYGIGGVKQTSEGNFYVISQTLECDECDCEKLYKAFMTEHTNCWQAYQMFLEEMETNRTEYFKDYEIVDKNEKQIQLDVEVLDSTQQYVKGNQDNEKTIGKKCENTDELARLQESSSRCAPQMFDSLEKSRTKDKSEDAYDGIHFCTCRERKMRKLKKYETSECKHQFLKSSRKNLLNKYRDNNQNCSCECTKSDSLQYDPSYAINLDPVNLRAPSVVKDRASQHPDVLDGNGTKLKRFAILRKIPRDIRAQRAILKTVLAGMAADGYPLAKLPDSHKLPHFKLWMELRSGRKWTQEDRKYYENFSIFAWMHTYLCYHTVSIPRVKLKPDIRAKITWNSAERCRDLIDIEKNKFHRKIKQQLINKTREFFPTLFTYEFPNRQFRNCYFAYLPNKEEDAILGT